MNQHTLTTATREDGLINDFGNLIGRHADWLDVGTFLRLAEHAAEAYFGGDEIDEYFQLRAQLLADALKRELTSGPASGHAPGDIIEGAQ